MRPFTELPFFHAVKQVDCYATRDGMGHHSMVVVAPDPMAGSRGRYSVLVILCGSGRTRCVGRELPLDEARKAATKAAPPWRRDR